MRQGAEDAGVVHEEGQSVQRAKTPEGHTLFKTPIHQAEPDAPSSRMTWLGDAVSLLSVTSTAHEPSMKFATRSAYSRHRRDFIWEEHSMVVFSFIHATIHSDVVHVALVPSSPCSHDTEKSLLLDSIISRMLFLMVCTATQGQRKVSPGTLVFEQATCACMQCILQPI